MQINHPTTELYFIFAFTYCKVRVYDTEVIFIRTLLEAHPQVELCTHESNSGFTEIDTRLLSCLIKEALPKIFEKKLTEQFMQLFS